MIDVINTALQVAMFFAFVGLIYCIVQVVDVIREERERLMWYRHVKSPVRTEDDDSAK
jgi:hypothetical protein